MGKRALITGIVGQDGSYLAKLLLEKGYEVWGGDRRGGDGSCRFKELGIERDVDVVSMDLLEFTNIYKIIEKVEPDEVYNLAAQSFVQASFEIPIMTVDVNALGALRLLEVLRCLRPGAKFYQASTSEMFGNTRETPQTEKNAFLSQEPLRCGEALCALDYSKLQRILRDVRLFRNPFQPRIPSAGAGIRHQEDYSRVGKGKIRVAGQTFIG